MHMSKNKLNQFPRGSVEYVVLHAMKQKKRGRNPSMSYRDQKNPRTALAYAEHFAYFPQNEKGYLVGSKLQEYVCSKCGASGCKLWREYQTFAVRLHCAQCAAAHQGKSIEDIDSNGRRTGESGDKTDQIGWFVPAIPNEDETGYWGYSAVPGPAVDWWKKLPTLPDGEKKVA